MGLEVVVRPVVLPNIRPSTPRILAPPDDPERGICTLSGGSGQFVNTVYSWSVSVSRSVPAVEIKRQVDTERVYQVDEQGNINRDNFIDVERTKKLHATADVPEPAEWRAEWQRETRLVYAQPDPRDNVEIIESDKTVTNPDPGGSN